MKRLRGGVKVRFPAFIYIGAQNEMSGQGRKRRKCRQTFGGQEECALSIQKRVRVHICRDGLSPFGPGLISHPAPLGSVMWCDEQ
ncbi:hypothetical protein GWA01_14290 [Gluconobacter wancherniae NBRC 103581]|uniref:Uncharacterized protein n=1 Tax=Gluconobacter wancherniae NBRC 103581 TaxID=656744 RepID=A0A511AZM8_9PROT|nr:hypothetical protein AA103581_0544 [Gluconobacter wancherniae NBRC 103581]GEK93659.1 hypothetical protein GWA01_14290 [Gluconobacter wancherniae NBRC 103581]